MWGIFWLQVRASLSVRILIYPLSKAAFNTVFLQVDAQRSDRNGMPEMTQFFANIANNARLGLSVLSKEELKVCWSEGKDDEAKMNGCLAKTISTWLAVFESEEGLNCLLAAKDNIGKIRACKANGATAQVIY